VIHRLIGALALVALGISMPVAAAPAQSTSWHDGPCTDNVGITIVVDFQELEGGVNVRCATGPVTSGLDALDKAGISWESASRFPGLVCRIAGKPDTGTESCVNTPPLNAYWAYWLAPRGGQWCYSGVGAGNRVPPPGSIEGWSFALDRVAVDTPPPRYVPPAPIDNQPPNPLHRSDCGTPSNAAPSTTTTAPATIPLATTATVSTPAVQPDPATTVAVGSESPTATSAPRPTTVVTTVGASTATSTSIVAAAGAVTTSTTDDASIDADRAAGGGVTTSSGDAADSTVALGTVDLGDDGRSDGGFGIATVLGVVAAAALIWVGVWAARRRRAAS
jgi:hypothetical protein